MMISITKAQVPNYLVGSDFYRSLSSDDMGEFSIPEKNLKLTPKLNGLEDLRHLLSTLQYWGTNTFPDELLFFIMTHSSKDGQHGVRQVLEEFEVYPELLPWQNYLDYIDKQATWPNLATIKKIRLIPFLFRGLVSSNDSLACLAIIHLKRIVTFDSDIKRFVILKLHSHCICRLSAFNARAVTQLIYIMYERYPVVDLNSFLLVLPLLNWTDQFAVVNSCAVIAKVSLWRNGFVDNMVDHNVAPKLMTLLDHSDPIVRNSALNAVGNIMASKPHHVSLIWRLNILPTLTKILEESTSDLETVMDACWIIYNIAAGAEVQAQSIVDAGLIPLVTQRMKMSKDYEIPYRCALTIENVYAKCKEKDPDGVVCDAWATCTKMGILD